MVSCSSYSTVLYGTVWGTRCAGIGYNTLSLLVPLICSLGWHILNAGQLVSKPSTYFKTSKCKHFEVCLLPILFSSWTQPDPLGLSHETIASGYWTTYFLFFSGFKNIFISSFCWTVTTPFIVTTLSFACNDIPI